MLDIMKSLRYIRQRRLTGDEIEEARVSPTWWLVKQSKKT